MAHWCFAAFSGCLKYVGPVLSAALCHAALLVWVQGSAVASLCLSIVSMCRCLACLLARLLAISFCWHNDNWYELFGTWHKTKCVHIVSWGYLSQAKIHVLTSTINHQSSMSILFWEIPIGMQCANVTKYKEKYGGNEWKMVGECECNWKKSKAKSRQRTHTAEGAR